MWSNIITNSKAALLLPASGQRVVGIAPANSCVWAVHSPENERFSPRKRRI